MLSLNRDKYSNYSVSRDTKSAGPVEKIATTGLLGLGAAGVAKNAFDSSKTAIKNTASEVHNQLPYKAKVIAGGIGGTIAAGLAAKSYLQRKK